MFMSCRPDMCQWMLTALSCWLKLNHAKHNRSKHLSELLNTEVKYRQNSLQSHQMVCRGANWSWDGSSLLWRVVVSSPG
ncbi:hypothetical protein KC19_6G053100 [Ceratodon purpureus]|uniref:Uncharacterized protein n=1 Tax=Ceratodon purpureus TaxID=3225 RepID=A0A8T0HE48_CERPU|nr:hypothetical protein KC19_6G053100 [Ceratodon purpureus]